MDFNVNLGVDDSLDYEEQEEGELSGGNGGVDPSIIAPIQDNNNSSSTLASSGVDPGDCALQDFLGSMSRNEDRETPQELQDSFLDILAAEAEAKDGPAILPAVAKLVENHLIRKFQRGSGGEHDPASQSSMVVDKFKKYPVPSNLSKLKSCRTNDSVFKAMTPMSKRCNGDLHLAESALCKGITAQATAMQELAGLKHKLPKSVSAGFDNIFRHMADAVEFTAFSRSKVNETRRETILSNLNTNYKPLVSNTTPENGLLFGDNLENAMRSVETSNRLAQRLSAPRSMSRPFLGFRGRSRGRNRPHSYRTQYQPRQQSQRGRRG